ncbi:hypothetical protein ACH4D4_04850 [Streptomyces pristinaespiralis]|uniref:hypothetical protein n=1 Tax=Streptomyces pristinaespiralis TaxID=38300 RepID=UPI00379F67F8
MAATELTFPSRATQPAAFADALAAINTIGTTPGTRILATHRIGTAIVVAQHNDAWDYPYAVDSFRLPTDAETDPELADWARVTPNQWLLVEQAGALSEDDVTQMLDEAVAYLQQVGIVPTDSDPDMDEALRRVRSA